MGLSVLRLGDLANFLVRRFPFLHIYKLRFFGFGVLRTLQVFSNLVGFGFRFLFKMIAVFRIFLPNAF